MTNATGYTIEVDNNADFSSPEYTHACSGNSHNCSGLNESTLYYWRVSASGTCSVTGTWSDAWSFETGTNGMDAPTLESPADNSTEQPLALTLSWNTVSDATGYQFQLDDNDDFSSPLYNEAVTGTSTDISELDEGITYFWQVRATGECATGDWSDIWQFETGASVPEAITAIKEEGYYLGQNYPNPFMETTTIQFRLPVDGQVEVEFMDLQGKLVESLTGYYPAGAHTLEVDLSGKVHAGVYLYRMRTLSFTDTKLCIVR